MTMTEANTSNSIDSDNEDVVEYQRGISDGFSDSSSQSTGKSMQLYCFACHRMEYHYNALKGAYYHHLLVGLTFGLALIFGPYRCRCCGYRRMVRYNFLNPRYHYHRWKYKKTSSNSSKTISTKPHSLEPKRSSKESIRVRSSSRNGHSIREKDSQDVSLVDDIDQLDEDADHKRKRRKRRKSKTLKAVPLIESIGKDRKEKKQEEIVEHLSAGQVDFSIEGLVGSFETEESRKMRQAALAEERAQRGPFVAKKAKPRKKIKGKPKRRFAKKERLTGPKLYCFTCKQTNEHFHFLKGKSSYFFFFGITFGLISIIGPMRCSVCDKRRLFCADFLNPKYYLRQFLSNSKNGYG